VKGVFEMNNENLDSIFSVLENPIRRKILAKLAKEHHYPLQLSKELNISQQAIMKHLKVLEEHNLVKSFEEKSTLGGPPRKCYVSNKYLSMRIDIGPNTFKTDIYDYKEMENEIIRDDEKEEEVLDIDVKQFNDKFEKIKDLKEPNEKLKDLSELIQELNKELEDLKLKRSKLLNIQEQVVQESNRIIGELYGEYDERKLMYYIMSHQERDLATIAEALDLRERVIMDLIKHLLREQKIFGLDDGFFEF
jgi:predicted transcriptional regulator